MSPIHKIYGLEGQVILNFSRYGNGKDVVFLHGWGGSINSFDFVGKQLSGYRITLLDLSGFGLSPEPSVPMGVSEYADEVIKTLNKLKVVDAIFVGHSFGGRVAIEIASRKPYVVNKLILVDSAGLKPRRKPSYYFKVAIHKFLKKIGKPGLKGSIDYAVLSPVMKMSFKKIVNYDQSSQLKNVICPTAIFWGKSDKETPPYMARKFKRKIKDSALFWLDGGHFAYVDDFGRFLHILKAFVEQE